MSASALLGVVQLVAGAALFTVGLLGWQRRLPRNRFAGVRTPATLRSEAAFIAANRVAAPPVLAVIVGVTGAGAVGLLLAGGLLGHRVAATMPPPAGGCAGCTCARP